MSKFKKVKEKHSKIKEINQKDIEKSPLEKEIEKTSKQQFTEFISTSRTTTPPIKSEIFPSQISNQDRKTIVRDVASKKPDLPKGPEYKPLILSELASGRYEGSSRIINAPILRKSNVLIGSSEKLGFGEKGFSLHEEERKYAEESIKSEDMRPKRKMPWE